MKQTFLYFLMIVMASAVAARKDTFQENEMKNSNEAIKTLHEFKKTTPLILNDKRLSLLKKIETYSDNLQNTVFNDYMESPEEAAVEKEKAIPILYLYREGFNKILDEVKNSKVKKGTALIWMLYNMGFIVKTPSGCFGIDIDHRLAVLLEPYLNFVCITHNHRDHYNLELIEAMNKNVKPVLSNFYEECKKYCSTLPANYKIGEFTIRTDISDHLANPDLPDFVTLFRIDCGKNSGDFSILHCGDSGFNPKHFTNVDGPVNMVILRWGAPRENNIIGTNKGQITPDYAVLSHLIELRHKPYPHGQASITKTLEHLPGVNCDNTIIPFWGEKMIWNKNKLR